MGVIRGLSSQPADRLIGSVWEMRRSAKPTSRPDGSALGVGDRLILSTDGTQWTWNGTYWLSSQSFERFITLSGTTPNSAEFAIPFKYNLFIDYAVVRGSHAAPQDAANKWQLSVVNRPRAGSFGTIYSIYTTETLLGAGSTIPTEVPVALHIPHFTDSFTHGSSLRLESSLIGSPGGWSGNCFFLIMYRYALK